MREPSTRLPSCFKGGDKLSYIVPEEMQKCCVECPCGYETEGMFKDVCLVLARDYEKDADSARPNWCPLIEIKTPHGRLIDADELLNETLYNPMSPPYITKKMVLAAKIIFEAEKR